jgi:hypothetical protein
MTAQISIEKVISHLNSVACSNGDINRSYSSNNKSLIYMLMDLTVAIAGGTLPGDPCYMNKLPSVILDIILTFLPYRDTCVTQRVCKSMNMSICKINTRSLLQLNDGCELWVTHNKIWKRGTIISNFYNNHSSVVELIDIKSGTRHIGYNIKIDYSGSVCIKQSDILRYTHTGSFDSIPKVPTRPFEYMRLCIEDNRTMTEIYADACNDAYN